MKTVLVEEHTSFKNKTVDYEAVYQFCELAEELYMNEQQMQDNNMRLKEAYRFSLKGELPYAESLQI